jgi:hypothetical protein
MERGLIIVTHSRVEGRFRFFKDEVFLDGQMVARIKGGTTVQIEADPGEHVLHVQANRLLQSPEVSFCLAAGEVARFRCTPAPEVREAHRQWVRQWLQEGRGRLPQRFYGNWFRIERDDG